MSVKLESVIMRSNIGSLKSISKATGSLLSRNIYINFMLKTGKWSSGLRSSYLGLSEA